MQFGYPKVILDSGDLTILNQWTLIRANLLLLSFVDSGLIGSRSGRKGSDTRKADPHCNIAWSETPAIQTGIELHPSHAISTNLSASPAGCLYTKTSAALCPFLSVSSQLAMGVNPRLSAEWKPGPITTTTPAYCVCVCVCLCEWVLGYKASIIYFSPTLLICYG